MCMYDLISATLFKAQDTHSDKQNLFGRISLPDRAITSTIGERKQCFHIMRQWAQAGTQASSEHEEALLRSVGDRALA